MTDYRDAHSDGVRIVDRRHRRVGEVDPLGPNSAGVIDEGAVQSSIYGACPRPTTQSGALVKPELIDEGWASIGAGVVVDDPHAAIGRRGRVAPQDGMVGGKLERRPSDAVPPAVFQRVWAIVGLALHPRRPNVSAGVLD